MAEMGKQCFNLFITPSVRETLLAILCVCEFQFKYSFTVNPRKLGNPLNLIVIYHKAWNVVFRYNTLTVVKYHQFNFLYIER